MGTSRCDNVPAIHVVDHARLAAHEIVYAGNVQAVLAALIRLGVMDALARAGGGEQLTVQELAEAAQPGKPVNVRYLERFLRLMSCQNVLSENICAGVRRYGLAPIGKYFVTDTEKGSLAHLHLIQKDPTDQDEINHLHESVLDDSLAPFARLHGTSGMFESNQKDPELEKLFNRAMTGHSQLYMHAILDVYTGLADVDVLVDVGGGFGTCLSVIIARYPHIRGINFDQPHVVAACPELPGVEHVGGDMFESVPSGGDAIFMKWILHDWSDEKSLKLLKNCCKALPAGGKVVVADLLVPETNGGDSERLPFLVDITMFAYISEGARERTEKEFRELGLAAGFAQVGLLILIPRVVDAVKGYNIPVIAAGGIVDDRGYVAVLARGAQGVCMGTRFLATEESYVHPVYKQKIVETGNDGTEYTKCVFGRACLPSGAHRVLRTSFFETWRKKIAVEEAELGQPMISHSTIFENVLYFITYHLLLAY